MSPPQKKMDPTKKKFGQPEIKKKKKMREIMQPLSLSLKKKMKNRNIRQTLKK